MHTNRLHAAIDDAIVHAVTPGAVIGSSVDMAVPTVVAHGRHTYDATAPEVTPHTIYDLASITKIITATAAFVLVSRGEMGLESQIRRFLPESHAGDVLLTHLLTHTSGIRIRLSAHAQTGADALWQAVHAMRPSNQPGSVVEYANVNTLLLGAVIERVTSMSLDRALDELVLTPAHMTMTRFNPPRSWSAEIPPTEIDDMRGVVRGHVHDESCAALGGVAGHAGLFGVIDDLLRFGQAWLATLNGAGPWQIAPELARQAITLQTPLHQLGCGLGWMMRRQSFMGKYVDEAVGHTGFTGPVIGLVPSTGLVWSVLCNRTWPKRMMPPQHHGFLTDVVQALG
jgi:serine-type D-Ala-D-Ala carboxypeptidase